MRSAKDNSTWISVPVSQEQNDEDWVSSQLSFTGKVAQFPIYGGGATSILVDDGVVEDGDEFLIRTSQGQYLNAITKTLNTFPNPTSNTDIASAVYDNVSFSVATQATANDDFCFNGDGTRMFVINQTNATIYQYNLSIGFDMSTASYATLSYNFGASVTDGARLDISNDGTKLFIYSTFSYFVYQFTLSIANDISSATYDGVSYNAGSIGAFFALGMELSADGTKIIFINGSGTLYTVNMTTPYNLSTAVFSGSTYDASREVGQQSSGMTFNDTGSVLYINKGYFTHQYSLSTPYDVATARYSQTYSNLAEDSANASIRFAGTKLYKLGNNTNTIYQYSVNGTYNLIISTLDLSDLALSAAPTGFFKPLPKISATMEQTINRCISRDIAVPVTASTTNSIKVNYAVENAIADGDVITIDDGDAVVSNVSFATEPGDPDMIVDIDNATQVGGAFIDSTQVGANRYLRAFQFSPDGLKALAIIYNTSTLQTTFIIAYNLTAPFDTSSLGFNGDTTFDFSSFDTNAVALVFSPDGTRMYVQGANSGTLSEFTLSTAFDVSTATLYNQVFGDPATQIRDAKFTGDGSRAYIMSRSQSTIYTYDYAVPYDTSTGTFNSGAIYSIAEITNPIKFTFNNYGNRMYVLDEANTIHQYNLSVPFDVASRTYTAITYFANGALYDNNNGLISFAFGNDGQEMRLGFAGPAVSNGSLVHKASMNGTVNVAEIPTYSMDIPTQRYAPTKAFIKDRSVVADYVRSDYDRQIAMTFIEATNTTITAEYPDPGFIQPGDTIVVDDGQTQVISVTSALQSNGNYLYDITVNQQQTVPTFVAKLTQAFQSRVVNDLTLKSASTTQVVVGYYKDLGFASGDKIETDEGTFLVGSASLQKTGIASAPITQLTSTFNDFNTSTTVGPSSESIKFNSTGTKIIYLGANNTVYELNLSVAYDITTATYNNVSFSVSGQVFFFATDMTFNATGTRMFILDGEQGDRVVQYDLSIAYDITTSVYNGISLDVKEKTDWPESIAFNDTGTRMFILGRAQQYIDEYALSVPYSVDTAVIQRGIRLDVFNETQQNAKSIRLNNTGTKMFVAAETIDTIFEFDLESPFSLKNANYKGVLFAPTNTQSISCMETIPTGVGMLIGANGSIREYVVNVGNLNSTYSYDYTIDIPTHSTAPTFVNKVVDEFVDAFPGLTIDGNENVSYTFAKDEIRTGRVYQIKVIGDQEVEIQNLQAEMEKIQFG